MKIIPFEPGHVDIIVPQPAQAAEVLSEYTGLRDQYYDLADKGPAITAVADDGEIVFCLGKLTQWRGRHIIWALVSAHAGKYMVSMVRTMKKVIELQAGEGRLEVIVRADFPEGCRLAEKFMGFKFHHYEERFLPDGSDAKIFVRYV